MKIIATLAATAALAIAAPAFAESIAVDYHDLDLSTAQGQKTLDRRLDEAAREVCGMNEIRTGTRVASSEARACFKATREQLSQQVAAVVAKDAKGG